jgi:hypothetical protein
VRTLHQLKRWIGLVILSSAVGPALAGTWFDSFSSGDLGADWRGDTKAFWILNDTLHGESASAVAVSPLFTLEVGTNWSNYTISCAINIISPNTHVCTKGTLILRHSGNEGYVFALHEPTQTVEIYRLSNHEMLLSKPASIQFKKWYFVRAEAQNDSLSFWVDDVFIGTISDSRSPSGAVGVGVQDANEVLYDDFRVSGPEIPDHGNEPASYWSDNFSGEVIGAQWEGDSAAFTITNSALKGLSVSGPISMGPLNTLEVPFASSNYTVTCSINILRPEIRDCSKGALILRHAGEEGYVFALHEPTQTIELYRLSNHEMLLSKPASINYTNWYEVRAEMQDDLMFLWVNNALIGMVRDDRSPTGSVGVAVQDAEALFDNFTVTARTGNEPLPLELNIVASQEGKLQFGLSEGAMISSGTWFLEVSHNLTGKSWERLGSFSPGDVSAFAEDSPPAGDMRPRFYRAVWVP